VTMILGACTRYCSIGMLTSIPPTAISPTPTLTSQPPPKLSAATEAGAQCWTSNKYFGAKKEAATPAIEEPARMLRIGAVKAAREMGFLVFCCRPPQVMTFLARRVVWECRGEK